MGNWEKFSEREKFFLLNEKEMAECDTYSVLKPKGFPGEGTGYSLNSGMGIGLLILLIVEVFYFFYVIYAKPAWAMVKDPATGLPTDVYNWVMILLGALFLLLVVVVIAWFIRMQ